MEAALPHGGVPGLRGAAERTLLCRLEEIGSTRAKGIDRVRDGQPWRLFVVRHGGGALAYENTCPHQGAPLDWAPDTFLDITRSFIQCSLHGARFRIEDGLCFRGPCLAQRLSRVAIRVTGGEVHLADEVAG